MVRLEHPERHAFADPVDLRRRSLRDHAETIVVRAEHLLPDDRALLQAVFRDGMTAIDLARVTGTAPRALRRRIRLLAGRVLTARYAYVMRHREHWPATRRRVATACVLQGRSLRAAAAHLRLTLHVVRRHMDAVNALYESRSR